MKKLLILAIITVMAFSLFAGLSKNVGVALELEDHSFPLDADFVFEAYIDVRPTEILLKTSGGCFYNEDYGMAVVNVGNFATDWAADDILVWVFYYQGIPHGSKTQTLLAGGTPQYDMTPYTLIPETQGYGEGTTTGTEPLVVDLSDINIDGYDITGDAQSVNPPAGEILDIVIQLAGDIQGGQPIEFPANVIFSYAYGITGGTVGSMTISFVADFTGYTGDAFNYIFYWDGADWVAPDNVVWTPPTVSFDITYINAKDGNIEVITAVDDPTPVTLSNFFVAQTQGEFATIGWTTESETNMLGYNIYRSDDDVYVNADIINSEMIVANNFVEQFNYTYTDETVEYNNTYYYWLEVTAKDGTTTILANDSITIEEPPALSDFTALKGNYPNPFNPSTKIEYFVKAGETATLTIYNAKGQLVEKVSLSETLTTGDIYEWEGTKYGSGIYFYKLKTDSYSQVKKMMMLK